MKKLIRLFWQLLLFPAIYFPYRWFHQVVLVKWLGCGSPRFDENGRQLPQICKANDVTWFFWWGIALLVVVISLFQLRKIKRWQYKVLYLMVVALVCCITVPAFFNSLFVN